MLTGFWWLIIPLGFVALGVFAKKLSGPLEPRWKDLYLAIDLTLVSLSSTIINGLDLSRQSHQLPFTAQHKEAKEALDREQERSWVCAFVCFGFFVAVGLIHRRWEEDEATTWGRNFLKQFMVVGVANLLGVLSLACFTTWVKGLK
jgi:hypothetical protein